MSMKSLLLAAPLALILACAVAAQTVPAPVAPSPVKRTIVGKTEVPGSNYEVVTAMVEIAPGFKAPRHFHPGIVQVEVLEGEFWTAVDGQPEKTYTAGQHFELPMKIVHAEGATGDKTMKLIAVYVVEKGQPLINPVK